MFLVGFVIRIYHDARSTKIDVRFVQSRSHMGQIETSQDITFHSANHNIKSGVPAGFITTYLSGSK